MYMYIVLIPQYIIVINENTVYTGKAFQFSLLTKDKLM